jgi:Ca2+-binding EF-hand superfamily protein|tara:strand:+ start:20 stop:607 length:588 start_codon:yes stop_codon:yes gene_type:complete
MNCFIELLHLSKSLSQPLLRTTTGRTRVMGAMAGRYSDATEGKCDRIFDRLGITKGEGMKFFKMFEKVDKDHSGSINLDEFFKLMDLEWSSFAMKAFQIMDVDKQEAGQNNELEFSEFFVGLWNYCTLDRSALIKFAFDLYDRDGSGAIEMAEMRQLVKSVFGTRSLDQKTMKIMQSIDIDNSGSIRFSEFQVRA